MRTFCSLLFLWVNFLTLCAQPLIKKTTPTNEGACTARAFVEFTAGTTGPYFLSLDGPTTLSGQKFHKRTILRNLCAGTHKLTLTDDFNCTTSTEFTIHECQELSLTNPDLFLTQPTSCEAADGIYRLSLDGLFASQQILNGTAPFAFTLINLSNGDQRRLQSGAGGLNWENLSAGNYLLQMEDSKDCKGSHRFSLTSPEGNRPVVHGVDEIPACTNGRPGYLYVVAAGPNQEACEFSWNDPQLPVETSTSSLIEVQPGQEYAVTISCCNNPDCAVVLDNLKVTAEVPDDPLGILDEVSVGNTCLNGPYSGTVEIQVSGGIAPYRFQWSNGAIGRKLTNALVDATYCVTVTDGCDNTATRCPYIPPSPYALLGVEADVSPTNQLGSIELWPSGGDGDYRFHWSNGSSEQNLYNLVSGIYQVTVSDGQGCEVIESYEINNCRGGTHDGNDPLRVDAIAHGNPSGQGCQGNKTLRVRTAQGGQPPYLLHIELVSSPVDPDFADIRRYEVQPMGYPQNLNTLDFEVPAGRYFIRLFDACGNEVNQSVDLCEHCGYTYDPGRRRFSLGDRGQVEIILHCDCAFRCDGQDNYLELKFISRGMTEMDYALTWPDGSQAFFEYNQGGHISGQVRYHFEQPPPSGRIDEVVQVERADGCAFEIPVIVNDGGQESILFSDLHSNYGGQYYTGTSVCNLCVPDPGYYEPQEATCFDGIDPETLPMVFGYLPNNINNPCAGGGKLQAHRIVNGEIVVYTFDIPANSNVPIEVNSVDGGLTDRIVEGFDCDGGGHCLFDAMKVYGFPLSKLLLATYCRQYTAEIPDQDQDGIPDLVDNCPTIYDPTNKCGSENNGGSGGNPHGEDCYREVEVCKFGGCLKRVYCEQVDGSRALLREEETDLVIECRHEFTNGECRQLLYYCLGNCRYYRKGGTTVAGGPGECAGSDGPVCSALNEACNPLACIGGPRQVATDGDQHQWQDENQSKPTVKLYPNPMLDYIDVMINDVKTTTSFQLSIYDLVGRLLRQHSFEVVPSVSSTLRINGLGDIPPGILIFKVDAQDSVIQVERIVKVRSY